MSHENSLSYAALVKEFKNIDASKLQKSVKLAVLADFAIQQLIPPLKALAARSGVNLEIYEGPYDSIDLEILNEQSDLYKFKPDYIAILCASEKLKHRFYECDDAPSFVEATVGRFTNLWDTVRNNCSATIVQGNYVLPSERAFGNYELKVEESMGACFMEINYQLVKEARKAKNVLLCDMDFIAASVGRDNWFDARLWCLAKYVCQQEYLPLIAQSVANTVVAAADHAIKCVVLDLDNTLWGGVIGDDGVSGIVLGDFDEGEAFVAFQHFLKSLKNRGIILAVVSKNDEANALLPFREHPNMVLKEEDISVFLANWDNKADNIKRVQEILNIGFDTFVFLDDNPFERNIVREFLPQVIVPELPEDPAEYLPALASLNLFETASFSEADRKRGLQYREEAQRELTKTRFTDIRSYLTSLEMKVKLERFNSFNLPRIAQLMQRSNQFNLTTRRYSEAVCEDVMKAQDRVGLTLKLADKFGDYGLISVIILALDKTEIEIDEYLMSCRVLQRGVEHFAMSAIFDFAARNGIKRIIGNYLKSPKNDMVRNFYEGFGFQKVSEDEKGNSKWMLDVDAYQAKEVFMTQEIMEL